MWKDSQMVFCFHSVWSSFVSNQFYSFINSHVIFFIFEEKTLFRRSETEEIVQQQTNHIFNHIGIFAVFISLISDREKRCLKMCFAFHFFFLIHIFFDSIWCRRSVRYVFSIGLLSMIFINCYFSILFLFDFLLLCFSSSSLALNRFKFQSGIDNLLIFMIRMQSIQKHTNTRSDLNK